MSSTRSRPAKRHPHRSIFDFFGHDVAGDERQIERPKNEKGERHHHQGDRQTGEVLVEKSPAILNHPLHSPPARRQVDQRQHQAFHAEEDAVTDVRAFAREKLPQFAAELEKKKRHR